MGNPRGVKRDFEALEKRRFKAAKLFDKNLNNSEIGRRLKVSNQTVSRWRKECQEGGNVALRRAGRAQAGCPVWMRPTKPAWPNCFCKVPNTWVMKLRYGRCPRVADLIVQCRG